VSQLIHGTGLVLGETGVLVRGPSGAGKSLLALWLIRDWSQRGQRALLVADDQVMVEATGAGLVMRTPPRIAGIAELRGRGIVQRAHVPEARLDLVVDLVTDWSRMVEESELLTELCQVEVARCPVPRAGLVPFEHQILLIEEAISGVTGENPAARQKDT
jgi:serine kinase of HPr protein (carbohydrate metabolism regulator)